MALRGTFSDTEPEDVLQMLALGRKTGVLTVTDAHRTTRLIFEEGMIIDAYDGLLRGEDAVVTLLIARRGQFAFRAQPVPAERTVHRDVSAILLRAARQLDDAKRAKELMRHPTARVYRLEEMVEPNLLDEAERKLLGLVNDRRTVGELVAASGLSLERAYVSLASLAERGLIGVATAEEDADRPPAELLISEEPSDLPSTSADNSGPLAPEELREIALYLQTAVRRSQEEGPSNAPCEATDYCDESGHSATAANDVA
ncbi:MAG: DUF4388 domain-containing protein [Candidatus Zipacnadales bacterium]